MGFVQGLAGWPSFNWGSGGDLETTTELHAESATTKAAEEELAELALARTKQALSYVRPIIVSGNVKDMMQVSAESEREFQRRLADARAEGVHAAREAGTGVNYRRVTTVPEVKQAGFFSNPLVLAGIAAAVVLPMLIGKR